jgi:acetyl esterase/lipase
LACFEDYTAIGDVAYGDHELNLLDIYLSAQKNTSRATVIFFYGGCETLKKEHYLFIAQALTSHGYAVVIPDYRHYPEMKFAQIIHDASLSVEWVKAHN